MKNLWHKRRDREGLFYRCAECGEDCAELAATGAYLRLGNEVIAIVCMGNCMQNVHHKLRLQLPYAFPELDAEGYVLDASAQAPFAPIDAAPDPNFVPISTRSGPPAAGEAAPSEACGSPSDRAALSSGGAERPVPPEASAPEGRENQEDACRLDH